MNDVPPQTLDLPHLVLYRNGALADSDERTLIVEVSGIEVPPAGVTVTLRVETQHGDPVLGRDSGARIPVWGESRWIANTSAFTQTGVMAVFTYEFDETVISGTGTIATLTDYFRYDISVTDVDHPPADPLHASGEDYALLMENQWIAPLPEIMDRALAGSSCPFQTHAESLAAFACAIHALRVDGGRCMEPGTPAGCGFYDPYGLYYDPPLGTITYTGAGQRYSDGIESSFGMDFVDVILNPAAEGQPVTLEFHGAPGADAEFNVQIWQLALGRLPTSVSWAWPPCPR